MGATMKAVQYVEIGSKPQVVEIPTPEPGPGQVLLKVTAAGLCHSDSYIMGLSAEQFIYGLPLTLGHEGAGTVAAVGAGVTGIEIGTSYAVYGSWGCGYCYTCSTGAENYCERATELGIRPPGLGAPGALAEYLLVDSPRYLVPLGDLDPVQNVALTDAGLTPYHAIKPTLPKLLPGSTAVCIGVGGLGHMGVQILRALSDTTVIAVDTAEDKRQLAVDMGAHHALPSDESAIEAVLELTGGKGATAVFDFVAIQPTADLARKMVRVGADIVVVGVGSGTVPVGFFSTPFEASVRATYWGSRPELYEVLDLARSGAIHVETQTFSLDETPHAYDLLHSGDLRGRAVVVP